MKLNDVNHWEPWGFDSNLILIPSRSFFWQRIREDFDENPEAMSSIASSGGLVSSGGPYYMISRALGAGSQQQPKQNTTWVTRKGTNAGVKCMLLMGPGMGMILDYFISHEMRIRIKRQVWWNVM